MEKITLPTDVLPGTDIVCFAEVRWNDIYQQSQYPFSNAQENRVFFIEQPVFEDNAERLHINGHAPNIWVITPYLDTHLNGHALEAKQKEMVNLLFSIMSIEQHIHWNLAPDQQSETATVAKAS